MTDRLFIPERFMRVVVLHIVKNFLPQQTLRAPLLLGIHGPSGDGKTFQCEKILQDLGVKSFLISGGQLESHEAGEPAKLIRTAYLNAGRSVESGESRVAVVLINDFDTGVGSWGDMVQYTINRQTVFGELMHIVDYPTNVEGRKTTRIPIILTGNDFTKLYAPLTRAGRMTAFEWIPTSEDRIRIISRIYPELNTDDVKKLVEWFQQQPIAFFSHMRTSLMDESLWNEIQRLGIHIVIRSIGEGIVPVFNVSGLSLDNLIQHGALLLESGTFLNHLQKE